MRLILGVAIATLFASAQASARRVAVVGVAPCSAELDPLIRGVRGAAAHRLDLETLDEPATQAPWLARPGSPAEWDASLKAALQALGKVDLEGATRTLDTSVACLARLSPSTARWELLRTALTLRAWVALKAGKGAEATRDALRILRVEPTHVPDDHLFPPLVRTLFTETLLAMRLQPTAELAISSEPVGLAVDIDGREVGRTPLKTSLPRADYRVEVDLGDGRALVRSVSLSEPVSLVVDARLELAARADSGPCLDLALDRESETAAHLAQVLDVSDVVAVSRAAGSRPLEISVIRGGSGPGTLPVFVDLEDGALSADALDAIGELIASGTRHAPLRTERDLRPPPAVAPALILESPVETLAASRFPRAPAFVAGGATLIAATFAGGFAVDGLLAQRSLASHLTADGRAYSAGSEGAVTGLSARSRTDGQVALGAAMGAGALALTTAVLGWLSTRGEPAAPAN